MFWLAIGVKLLEKHFFVLFIVSESPSIVDLSGFSNNVLELTNTMLCYLSIT